MTMMNSVIIVITCHAVVCNFVENVFTMQTMHASFTFRDTEQVIKLFFKILLGIINKMYK